MKTNIAIIFGGSGFIAKHLVDYLLKNYLFDEIVIADLIRPANNNQAVRYIKCDVRKKIEQQFFSSDNSKITIFNFAAIHREPGHLPNEYYETNIIGAQNICDFADNIGCDNLIFTSSISIYGSSHILKSESTLPMPSTPYGISKFVAEKIHQSWVNSKYGRVLTIVRPGVVFGKDENGNMSRLVKLIYKNIFFYSGNKDTLKAGIYVKELIEQMIWVNKSQVNKRFDAFVLFNSTFWPNYSLSNYVDSIKKVANISMPTMRVPYFFLYFISSIIDLIFNLFKKENQFSPVRIRKLKINNFIKPNFLISKKYKFKFNFLTSLKDWKKDDPEIWSS